MHKELFRFNLPVFLSNNNQVTVYTYAFVIAVGCLIAAIYTRKSAKKELKIELPNSFFYMIFSAGFVGGKVLFFLEKPLFYYANPKLILSHFKSGYVFYGSFIFCILAIAWYLKKKKIPVLPMLDILAITTLIVHGIGRLGCFFAGCCYGKPTDYVFGVVFPLSNKVAVHPTQLYEATILFLIMIFLLYIKKHKQFIGQIFILYLSLYAISRTVIELFRGDKRGYLIDGMLSHSQGIALVLIIISVYFYYKLFKNKLTVK